MEKIEHPMHGDNLEQTPRFAILQFANTKRSHIWNGKEWIEAEESEYEPLALMARFIRTCPNPMEVVEEIVKVQNEKQKPKENWDQEPGFFIPPEELDDM
jgi:hypothetical protein